MNQELLDALNRLKESLASETQQGSLNLVFFLVVGGLMSVVLRMVYHRFGNSISSRDSISRIFPLLTIVTIAVIAVVKSSVALSLGLLGALSIVRFRAAIKEPEELVYLFLCIGLGLALGSEHLIMALALLFCSVGFIVLMALMSSTGKTDDLLLTIVGSSAHFFGEGKGQVLATIEPLVGGYRLQRFDVEDGKGYMRILINRKSARDTNALLSALHRALPEYEFSMVNLSTAI